MSQTRDAQRVLAALEDGGADLVSARILAEGLDPVLVYVIIRFLRANYPASDPAATSVLQRVVELTSGSTAIRARFKTGEQDAIARWFEREHTYSAYRGRGATLIERIVDKLES